LGPIAKAQNILVINDEAHHAWRRNPENKEKSSKELKEAEKEATIWISGLDRIHRARKILACYDFSATPFAPSGKKNDAEALFTWIVSDFGLNDGIESGLVKTPRIVVRDDNPLIQKFPLKALSYLPSELHTPRRSSLGFDPWAHVRQTKVCLPLLTYREIYWCYAVPYLLIHTLARAWSILPSGLYTPRRSSLGFDPWAGARTAD
jgi:hypothetical protein